MPNHHQGPSEEIRALDAYIKLVRAFNSLANRLAPALAGSGLTEGSSARSKPCSTSGRSTSATWPANTSRAAATSP